MEYEDALIPTSTPVAAAADFDGDGEVGFADFFLFADAFGGSDDRFDLNGNGAVDLADFFLFADHFGQPARAKLLVMAQELIGLPDDLQLHQNVPNPFNRQTLISFLMLRARSSAGGTVCPDRATGGGPEPGLPAGGQPPPPLGWPGRRRPAPG